LKLRFVDGDKDKALTMIPNDNGFVGTDGANVKNLQGVKAQGFTQFYKEAGKDVPSKYLAPVLT